MNRTLDNFAKLHLGLITLLAAALLLGCATSSTFVVAQPTAARPAPPRGLRILVLPPSVTFQQAVTGETLQRFNAVKTDLQAKLVSIGSETCTQGGNSVVLLNDQKSDPARTAQGEDASELPAQLLRAFVPAEVLARLSELAKAHGCDAVLVQHCRVGHIMVEFTSAMPSGTGFAILSLEHRPIDSAQFTAAILKGSSGEVVWKNDVLLRKIDSDKRFDQAVRALFASLNPAHEIP